VIVSRVGRPDSSTGESFGFEQSEDAWLSRLRRASTPAKLGRLGEYELLAEIGRGSQGVVFKAVQPHTRRTVALKRLGAGSLATASMRSRFEREVEAACLLDHPGIVTVHGVEMLDGQPVIAMEWVEGQPIDAWAGCPHPGGCEPGHRRDESRVGAPPAPPRPVAEILTVFAQACDAVAHAHRRGVLHRDLKPSNILVDAYGRARVLDFGLAKLLPGASAWEETSLTRPGGFLGTPAYAPPEVLHDPDAVDTRSDIYSLGIILYKVLCGAVPFEGSRGIASLFDQVRRGVTRPPSAHRAGVGPELDAITLKAVALEPERRYATADDLAADVRRHLAGETVTALPPSRAYLVRKFVRRHRVPVALALGVFLITLTLAATATTYSFRLARGQGRLRSSFESERAAVGRAVQARNEAVRARNAAEASTREARAALGRASRQSIRHSAVAELLGLLWAQADPAAVADLRAAIDRAIETLAAQEPGRGPAPAALARRSLADVLQGMGMFEHALDQARQAHRLAVEADGPESRPAAMALVLIGQNLALMGRLAEAEAPLREAERLRDVNRPTEGGGAVIALNDLGSVLIEQGRAPEAEALFRRALKARTDPGDRVTAPVAPLHRGLGAALLEQGRFSEAEFETRKALDMPRDYAGWESDHAPRTRRTLARILHATGRLEEAEKEMHAAMSDWAALMPPDHPQMARESLYLGAIIADLGRADDALAVYASALERLGARLPENHPWLTQARLGRARILSALGQHDQAEALLRETLALALTTPSGSEALAAAAAEALADSLRTSGRAEEAMSCLSAAAEQLEPRVADDHPLSTRLAAWPRPGR
jgi:eukaryotic-like serine/threonine-protein kinase